MSIISLEVNVQQIKVLANELEKIVNDQLAATVSKRQANDVTFILAKRTRDISQAKKIR